MSISLVSLIKRRGNKVYKFFDYISTQIANIDGIEIQGAEHSERESSRIKIVKVFK